MEGEFPSMAEAIRLASIRRFHKFSSLTKTYHVFETNSQWRKLSTSRREKMTSTTSFMVLYGGFQCFTVLPFGIISRLRWLALVSLARRSDTVRLQFLVWQRSRVFAPSLLSLVVVHMPTPKVSQFATTVMLEH
ncbi:hypothetical protein OUZ56_005848 [Daphnia magna]|uniref:Uncharacterized protein n=1 Tax=Daphnia magna TaxID=35525 RepID=A0ABQ9YU66_9CRUS|nr:hypothetical protein OUZ56_005848 [Daphnia magna]